MKPTSLRKKWTKPVSRVHRAPGKIRRVISEETAKMLKDFFIGVVERGTGQSAKIPGITIAGKTGTSRNYIDGKYASGNYTQPSSDFFRRKGELVCLVIWRTDGRRLHRRSCKARFLSDRAAIINNNGLFSRAAFAEKGNDESQPLVSCTDVLHLQREAARTGPEKQRLRVVTAGDGNVVVRQVLSWEEN